mmetsp:Transcript_39576/g.79088  ORF Transcript_39576/g.79088 Transcript_39576/m.79088 type:complete len:250 (-) Transcript_39576:1742-2491(-)
MITMTMTMTTTTTMTVTMAMTATMMMTTTDLSHSTTRCSACPWRRRGHASACASLAFLHHPTRIRLTTSLCSTWKTTRPTTCLGVWASRASMGSTRATSCRGTPWPPARATFRSRVAQPPTSASVDRDMTPLRASLDRAATPTRTRTRRRTISGRLCMARPRATQPSGCSPPSRSRSRPRSPQSLASSTSCTRRCLQPRRPTTCSLSQQRAAACRPTGCTTTAADPASRSRRRLSMTLSAITTSPLACL